MPKQAGVVPADVTPRVLGAIIESTIQHASPPPKSKIPRKQYFAAREVYRRVNGFSLPKVQDHDRRAVRTRARECAAFRTNAQRWAQELFGDAFAPDKMKNPARKIEQSYDLGFYYDSF